LYGIRKTFNGAIFALVGAVVLVGFMSSRGMVNAVTALSTGTFGVVFTIILLLERRPQGVVDFYKLRVKYRYGGILAGAIVAGSLLL
jgi:hypothetical protein